MIEVFKNEWIRQEGWYPFGNPYIAQEDEHDPDYPHLERVKITYYHQALILELESGEDNQLVTKEAS